MKRKRGREREGGSGGEREREINTLVGRKEEKTGSLKYMCTETLKYLFVDERGRSLYCITKRKATN